MQGAQALTFYRTSILKKAIMALTGLIGIGFVLVHMYGNFKAFAGPEYFNHYAEGLRSLGAPILGHTHALWIMRVVLIASVVLHVWAAVDLYLAAKRARPRSYAMQRTVDASYASKTMRLGGLVIFFFVLFHLAHFTWGTPGIAPDFIPGDAYHNMVAGFMNPAAAIFYVIAVVALGLHLYHGGWSMVQTLGILNEKWDGTVRVLAALLGIVIAVGFSVVPVAVLLGILTL